MFCKKCGKQIADGSTSCQYCGAVVTKRPATNTYTNFNAPTSDVSRQVPPVKKQKKTPWKIIAPVVAVLLVVAIIFGVVSCTKGKQKEYEDKLRQVLEESTSKPVVEFMCDDFDSDGTYEAYAVVGKSEKKEDVIEYYDADICFVNEESAELIKESVRGHSNGTIKSDGTIYVSLEVYDEQTGKGVSFLYSANESRPVESEISGQYSNVRQEDGKILATDETGEDMEIDIPNAFRKLDTIEMVTFTTTLPEGVTDFTETTEAESTTAIETTTKEKLTVTTGKVTEPSKGGNADNLSSNLALYKAYLTTSKIDEIQGAYAASNGTPQIETFMMDSNKDGNFELLVRAITDNGYGRTIGESLFGIENGQVVELESAGYLGGDSSSFIKVVLDTQGGISHKFAVKSNNHLGIDINEDCLRVLSYDGATLKDEVKLETAKYKENDSSTRDKIAKIKNETSLYEISDGYLICYKINDRYVSKSEYDNMANRFPEATDNFSQMKSGTYTDPLMAYKGSF